MPFKDYTETIQDDSIDYLGVNVFVFFGKLSLQEFLQLISFKHRFTHSDAGHLNSRGVWGKNTAVNHILPGPRHDDFKEAP